MITIDELKVQLAEHAMYLLKYTLFQFPDDNAMGQ